MPREQLPPEKIKELLAEEQAKGERAGKAWLLQWFDAPRQAYLGGVIRRNVNDVTQNTSMDAVVAEARSRGWHVIETGDQVVVLCHEGDVRVLC